MGCVVLRLLAVDDGNWVADDATADADAATKSGADDASDVECSCWQRRQQWLRPTGTWGCIILHGWMMATLEGWRWYDDDSDDDDDGGIVPLFGSNISDGTRQFKAWPDFKRTTRYPQVCATVRLREFVNLAGSWSSRGLAPPFWAPQYLSLPYLSWVYVVRCDDDQNPEE